MSYRPARALAALCLALGACAPVSSHWRFLEPVPPLTQGTAVTIGRKGDTAFFFECAQDGIAAGLTASDVPMTSSEPRTITLRLDAEPAQVMTWQPQLRAYVITGEAAADLAARAALAYTAVFTIDGQRIPFSLKGSHSAMIRLSRVCPFIDVKG